MTKSLNMRTTEYQVEIVDHVFGGRKMMGID